MLWDKGYMMNERKDSEYVHVLYSIFDFWVQLKYTGKSPETIDATVLQLLIARIARNTRSVNNTYFSRLCPLLNRNTGTCRKSVGEIFQKGPQLIFHNITTNKAVT